MRIRSNAAGEFTFVTVQPGNYAISAEKAGWRSPVTAIVIASPRDAKTVDLVLDRRVEGYPDSAGSSSSPGPPMEFSDKPNFTVAGVTDWTAVGGHGSDTTLRTSESLARDILTLQPQASPPGAAADSEHDKETEAQLRAALPAAPGNFAANHRLGEFYLHAGRYAEAVPLLESAYRIDPEDYGNTYDLALACEGVGDYAKAHDDVRRLLEHRDDADLHRLLAEINEKLGDPLAAVREYELAVNKDPSEQNYFAWGSELLLHRAIWQAQEVFRKGSQVYPNSGRMLTALGAALFAGAIYDEASRHLCAASDMNPADPQPYIFLGKIQAAAPNPLPCIEPRLERYARQQSDNAVANYLYAMAIIKRQQQKPDDQALQKAEALLYKAVRLDAKCGEAWLQLGILSFDRREFATAMDDYRKAIEANPQLAEAHYRLGVAYDRTGETSKAAKEFELHDLIERAQAEAIERQRREILQFVIAPSSQAIPSPRQ
jgi:tetratricopeptide (TPR) repeat protein